MHIPVVFGTLQPYNARCISIGSFTNNIVRTCHARTYMATSCRSPSQALTRTHTEAYHGVWTLFSVNARKTPSVLRLEHAVNRLVALHAMHDTNGRFVRMHAGTGANLDAMVILQLEGNQSEVAASVC